MRRIVIAVGTLLGAVACAAVQAQTVLTFSEAQRRAVDRSRQLAAQDAAIAASRQMAVAAGELPDPVLRMQLENVPVQGADRFTLDRDPMTMRSIGVMQEWTRGEKRSLRRQRFEGEALKGEAEKQAALATVERDTALAWLDVHYTQAMAAVLTEEAAAAQLEITAAESAYRAGRVNQSDVVSAVSSRTAIEDRISEFDRRVRNARIMLARWVGAGAEAPLGSRPAIDKVLLDVSTEPVLRHPQIEVLRRQEEVARTEASLARANKKADWTVELMYGNRASQFGDMATLTVSVPLQWFQKDRQDRELAARLAMAERMRSEREEMERAHLAEVRTMLTEWQNGLERLARYDNELIPLSRERTRAALAAYQGGKVASSDLLMARRNEIDVRMQALQLEMDTARLWAQLSFLAPDERLLPVGFDVPGASSKATP